MKVRQLLEAEEQRPQTLVGSMLLKLFHANKPMKVLITGMTTVVKHPDGKKVSVPVPDQEWDVTNVRVVKNTGSSSWTGGVGGLSWIRVENTSPESWFELLPDDDENLTIKKKDDYWLLTSRDGKGVKL